VPSAARFDACCSACFGAYFSACSSASTAQAVATSGLSSQYASASRLTQEPSAFCYAFAQNFQAINYYRLDPPGTTRAALLSRIKTNLAAGLPSMFGFTVYQSYNQAGTTGKLPYPTPGEKIVGGHAIVAVGYDDAMKIKNANAGASETTGALLIRNSWGTGWGAGGYGWLPYAYVLNGLAVDWWSLIKQDWIDTGKFG